MTDSPHPKNNSLSLPCTIREPGKEILLGVIKKDLGDRFVVYLPDTDATITISKIYVYPNLGEEHNDKSPSNSLSPSNNSKRRKKGTGSGSIYYRTVTRKGTDYQQAYYHYKLDGKKRTKYIPQKLLGLIEAAEAQKLPVREILFLLGEKQINPSKSSSICEAVSFRTLSVEPDDSIDKDIVNADISPSKNLSPSKILRNRGEGSGTIHCKPIWRGGKEYKQYWYHYEFWQSGERLVKKTRYIPKRLLTKVQRMEGEKVPVEEILRVLQRKKKG